MKIADADSAENNSGSSHYVVTPLSCSLPNRREGGPKASGEERLKILPGITRDSILKIAEDLRIPFKESVIPREMLYIADEVFFAGTAVEVTPIRSVDHIQVGKGVAGPITRKLQEEFFAITSGTKPDRHNWLTPVGAPVSAASR